MSQTRTYDSVNRFPRLDAALCGLARGTNLARATAIRHRALDHKADSPIFLFFSRRPQQVTFILSVIHCWSHRMVQLFPVRSTSLFSRLTTT